MEKVTQTRNYRGHIYRRAGSFFRKSEAKSYVRELHAKNTLAFIVTIDSPKEMGVGVKYHVYARKS